MDDRAKTSADTISRLMAYRRAERGETIKQFAERLGIPYGWLRRVSTAGIKQTSIRTLDHLKKLAAELCLADYRQLWEPIPDRLDPDEVVAVFKKWQPREWAILTAAGWSGLLGNYAPSLRGEQAAEVFLHSFIDHHNAGELWGPGTSGFFAKEVAEAVDAHFEVVFHRRTHSDPD